MAWWGWAGIAVLMISGFISPYLFAVEMIVLALALYMQDKEP